MEPTHGSIGTQARRIDDELRPLRRFALVTSFVLLTYAMAAVELSAVKEIAPLGIPLKINNPEWLGIGLALATLYGSVRFAYYGLMLSDSPTARRKRQLAMLNIGSRYEAIGPVNVPEQNELGMAEQYRSIFPRMPGMRVMMVLSRDQVAEDVQETLDYDPVAQVARLVVPLPIRFATFCEQLDYTAPVWFGFVSLGAWTYRVACT